MNVSTEDRDEGHKERMRFQRKRKELQHKVHGTYFKPMNRGMPFYPFQWVHFREIPSLWPEIFLRSPSVMKFNRNGKVKRILKLSSFWRQFCLVSFGAVSHRRLWVRFRFSYCCEFNFSALLPLCSKIYPSKWCKVLEEEEETVSILVVSLTGVVTFVIVLSTPRVQFSALSLRNSLSWGETVSFWWASLCIKWVGINSWYIYSWRVMYCLRSISSTRVSKYLPALSMFFNTHPVNVLHL